MFTLKNKLILVTGSSGQLGQEFARVLAEKRLKFIALAKDKLDITNFPQTEKLVSQIKPDIIINCAAYTQVDQSEEDPDLADKVNNLAVGNLVNLCRRFNIFFVHFSTDYVFNGRKEGFYNEDDLPNPINKYGMSKLKGEQAVKANLSNFLIFRVSWVIGKGGRNFLYKVFNWAKEKKVLKISSDEVSVPTYTEDIVKVTLFALGKKLQGLYHLASSGYCSRYEMAKAFIGELKLDNILIPVPMSTFKSKALRPLFSAMDNAKISKELHISIPQWQDAVHRFAVMFKKWQK